MVNLINDFLSPISPLSNITPFTYKDGETYLSQLERQKRFINETLIPFVNENVTTLNSDFIEIVQTLSTDVNAALVAQDAELTTAIDTVNTDVTNLTNYLDEQIASVVDNSATLQDSVFATLIDNGESESRTSLDVVVTDSALSNAYPLKRLTERYDDRNRNASIQQARVIALGDSIALFKWHTLYAQLTRALGGDEREAGVAVGSSADGDGWHTAGINWFNTNAGWSLLTNAFDVWFSGYAHRLTATGSVDFGTGGVNAKWDVAKIYYAKEAGAGTFQILVDGVPATGYENVSASGSGLGVIRIGKIGVAARRLTILGLTGIVKIIGPSFESSTIPGVVFSNISQGGISLDMQTTQGLANLGTFISDFDPDFITFEMKETANTYAANLEKLLDVVDSAAPLADFVGIGSTPTLNENTDQLLQNEILKAKCLEHGQIYWDGYKPFKSYAVLDSVGWAGDGIHVDDKASAFLADLMAADLRLFDHGGSDWPRNVNSDRVTTDELYIGRLLKYIHSETMTEMNIISGFLQIKNSNGDLIMQIGQVAGQHMIPQAATVGDTNNARLTGDATSITIANNAGNGFADLKAKNIAVNGGRITFLQLPSMPTDLQGAAWGDGTIITVDGIDGLLTFFGTRWYKLDATLYPSV